MLALSYWDGHNKPDTGCFVLPLAIVTAWYDPLTLSLSESRPAVIIR